MVTNTQPANSAAALFASLNANAAPAAAAGSVAATQNQFLQLLVTQMKNQDPLNPMDNAQVTSQMAQLSTVTGINNLNATLQALSNSLTSNTNQSLQASGMIGHGALVAGNNISLASGGTAIGGFQLPQSVDNAQVSVYDSTGNLVNTINLGAKPAGVVDWGWNGTDSTGAAAPAGNYTFAVNATQGGNSVVATPLQYGVINSVTQDAQGVTLGVGPLNGIAMSNIVQIL
ncbi:MAG TPA: flagellar hook assembly protein FlgD [Gallionella sp.]|nr:flagellar hook assembly protein FlgD [Gallionella sp.]